MISKLLVCSLSLILALSTTAFAQKPSAAPPTEEQRKAQQELEHKALALLDDIIKEGDAFKLAENRIQIKASSAYILWQYDEARARLLFRDVIASFANLLNNPPDAETPEEAKAFAGTKMLQGEILQMMATRDPRMAREFARATRMPNSQPGTDVNAVEEEAVQTDLGLATQIAERDPKLAVEIAEESLSKGLYYQQTAIISAVQAKDSDAAAKLAGEVMAKLRTEKLAEDGNARQVAVELLRIATMTPEKKDKATGTPLLDQAALRELTEMITAEAVRGGGNEDMLMSLPQVMPAIEKYSPARAAQLKQRIAKAGGGSDDTQQPEVVDPGVAEAEKYQPLMEKGSPDELLAAAAKVQPPMRDMFYQRAAEKLAENGDAEHARQLVNEKVQDADQRKSLLEKIDNAASLAEAEQGKIEQTHKMLAALRTNEERVQLLTQLAMGADAKGEKKVALRLLDEASGMISQRAKNINQLGAQLLVAHAYIQVDPSRSFAILEPIVDQLNELLGAATVLGGFFVDGLVRDDEIMLQMVITFLGLSGNEFSQYTADLSALARADFERTKNLVDKFQRDEVRITLRLILAQSILAPLPVPTNPATERTMVGEFNRPGFLYRKEARPTTAHG
jgi:hypothetical protein